MEIESYRTFPGFTQKTVTTDAEHHIENLEIHGFSVMENVLSREEAATYEARLAQLWIEQEEEFGTERLKELGEHGTHRGLLAVDPVFAQLVVHPRILEIVHRVLTPTSILNLQNASAAFPHSVHFQNTFHRDFAKDFVATRPLSMNAFFCITDFTKETGATQVVAGTHKMPEFPSDGFIKRNSIDLCAPAGSVLFWDSLLLHRAGYNTSDKARFGINHMYTRPFIKQQIDFPVFLKGLYDEESQLGQTLGFWTIPPKSVKEFRVDPSKRSYRRNQG